MYRGRRGTAPLLINLSTRRRWVFSFAPRRIYSRGKTFQSLMDKRMSGPHVRWVGTKFAEWFPHSLSGPQIRWVGPKFVLGVFENKRIFSLLPWLEPWTTYPAVMSLRCLNYPHSRWQGLHLYLPSRKWMLCLTKDHLTVWIYHVLGTQ